MTDIPPSQSEGGVFFNESPQGKQEPPSRARVFKFVLITIGALVLLVIVLVLYEAFLSPRARSIRNTQENYEIAKKGLSDFKEKMTADTYGGKTPQETLDLFIAALEKGDTDLAVKYAWWDGGASSIANQKALREGLEAMQKEGKIQEMVEILKKAKPLEVDQNSNDFKWLGIKNQDGMVEYSIIFRRNNFSGVWKIESL